LWKLLPIQANGHGLVFFCRRVTAVGSLLFVQRRVVFVIAVPGCWCCLLTGRPRKEGPKQRDFEANWRSCRPDKNEKYVFPQALCDQLKMIYPFI
jgi:hypothetical protein